MEHRTDPSLHTENDCEFVGRDDQGENLFGSQQNDILNDRGGSDQLEGGPGDNIYIADANNILSVWGGSGIGTVQATLTFSLCGG